MKKLCIVGPEPNARALADDLGLLPDQWHHVDKPSDLPCLRFNDRYPFFATDDWASLPDWEDLYNSIACRAEEDVMKKAGMVPPCTT